MLTADDLEDSRANASDLAIWETVLSYISLNNRKPSFNKTECPHRLIQPAINENTPSSPYVTKASDLNLAAVARSAATSTTDA